MVDFNQLSRAQARHSHRLLGGKRGVLRSGRKAPIEASSVIERSVKVPTESGMGYQTVIMGQFLCEEVGTIKKGDEFTVDATGEKFYINAIDTNDGVVCVAYMRS